MAWMPSLLALLLLVWGFSRVSCDEDEDILLALKQGISDGSGVMSKWVAGTGHCNWTGIQCNAGGRVESIILPNRLLQGTLTPLLGRLQYLRVINMEINNLTGSIPATLENCTFLANISLGSNQLSGVIPRRLDRLQGLQRLDLWNNQLEGTIPASLGNCSKIDYLSLGQNFLVGSIPPEIGKLSELLTLRLFTNSFVGSFPTFLTNCTKLQVISIRNNSLTGFLPKELEQLVVLQQLRIQSNFFEGTIPPHIGNMTTLYYIDISSNRLTGSIPKTFRKLRNLQELYLNNNSLTGRIPQELMGCQHLGTMDLSHNLLEGPLPENIGDIQDLTNLTLNHNMITGRIPDSIGRLRLINLDLSHNMLSGGLTPGLASLNNLQIAFNLAFNNLTGRIPSWIGNFKVVQNISLQSNRFTGEIPPSLGQCVGLQVLDLSSNQFSGVIPSTLASLAYLTSLNLSANQLQGPVPTGGAFRLFSAASFVGNPGLCGEVVNRACSAGRDRSSSNKGKTIAIAVSIVASFCIIILVAVWLVFRYFYRSQKTEVDPLNEQVAGSSSGGGAAGPLASFTADELMRITENFCEDNLIGVGGFSRVYKGKSFKGGVVAVKLLRIEMREEIRKGFFAEIKTLGQVKHRNLVRLLGYCWTVKVKALVLEYMPNGSLERHLKAGLLDWQTRFKIAHGVAFGMAYLHHEFDSPIIHCDLKPANVLLDADFEPRVADFGISKIAHPDEHTSVTSFRGSIGYFPPEYGSSTCVTTKGDVFSYGILLLELVTGRSPTNGMFGVTTSLQKWVSEAVACSRLSEVIDPTLEPELASYEPHMSAVVDLALSCTSSVPSTRPTMHKVSAALSKLSDTKVFPSMEMLLRSPSPYRERPVW